MNNPDVSALVAYPGKYERALMRNFMNGLDARNDVTFLQNVKSTLQMTKLTVHDTARPYTGVFAPIEGDLEYTGNKLEVEKAQRDLLIDPEQYRGTFMEDDRGAGENSGNKKIPFAQYVWETVLASNAAAINDRTIYHGEGKAAFSAFNALSTYGAGDLVSFNNGVRLNYYICTATTTAGQSPATHPAKWQIANAEAICQGFGPKIAAAITAGKLTPVTTGAVTSSSDAYDQFTEMWRALPATIRNRGGVIYCSLDDYDFMQDDFESKVSKYTEKDNSGIIYLAKTNKKCQIIPATWMAGTRRLIATVKQNLMIGTDLLSDMNKISVIPSHYTLEASISFVLGTAIRDFEWMRVSDQA